MLLFTRTYVDAFIYMHIERERERERERRIKICEAVWIWFIMGQRDKKSQNNYSLPKSQISKHQSKTAFSLQIDDAFP